MSKVHCNVIQDMIPLYVENICSEETRQIVDTHVCECNACREILAMSMNPTEIESVIKSTSLPDDFESEHMDIYKNIHKEVFKKAVKRIALIVMWIVCVVAVISIIVFAPINKATYQQAKIAIVEKEKGVFIDSYIHNPQIEIVGDTMIISGKMSYKKIMESKNDSNMFRQYQKLNESVARIVFEDKSGELYELWER